MIGKHWIIQVIIVVAVFNFDYHLGSPMVGLTLAVLYFFGILISAIKREWYMVNKRAAYMIMFILVGVLAAYIQDADPTIDLDGFIEGVVDDIWPASR